MSDRVRAILRGEGVDFSFYGHLYTPTCALMAGVRSDSEHRAVFKRYLASLRRLRNLSLGDWTLALAACARLDLSVRLAGGGFIGIAAQREERDALAPDMRQDVICPGASHTAFGHQDRPRGGDAHPLDAESVLNFRIRSLHGGGCMGADALVESSSEVLPHRPAVVPESARVDIDHNRGDDNGPFYDRARESTDTGLLVQHLQDVIGDCDLELFSLRGLRDGLGAA